MRRCLAQLALDATDDIYFVVAFFGRDSICAEVPELPHPAAHARRRACELLQRWRRRCAGHTVPSPFTY